MSIFDALVDAFTPAKPASSSRERTVTRRVALVATVQSVQTTRAMGGDQHVVELTIGQQTLRCSIPQSGIKQFPPGGKVRLVVEPYELGGDR